MAWEQCTGQAATAVGQFKTLTEALCKTAMLRRAQLIKLGSILDSEMTEIILKQHGEKDLAVVVQRRVKQQSWFQHGRTEQVIPSSN